MAEAIALQCKEKAWKVHPRQAVAAVEGQALHHDAVRQADAPQGGKLESACADGVHALGQQDLLQPTVAKDEGREGARTTLNPYAVVLQDIRLAAADEGGAAQVEPAQAAFCRLLPEIAAGHLAKEAQVRAVERALDGKVGEVVLLLLAYQRGERAGRLHDDAPWLPQAGRLSHSHGGREQTDGQA